MRVSNGFQTPYVKTGRSAYCLDGQAPPDRLQKQRIAQMLKISFSKIAAEVLADGISKNYSEP
jgi:hypothetical protein